MHVPIKLKFLNGIKNWGGNKKPMIIDRHRKVVYSYKYSNKNANNQNHLSLKNKNAIENIKGSISYVNFKKMIKGTLTGKDGPNVKDSWAS